MAGFDGTLTKSVAWSKGKYIPKDSGGCLVARADRLVQILPANVTRMQWVTWSDWEEGTEVETGIDNALAIDAHLEGTQLAWSVGVTTSSWRERVSPTARRSWSRSASR